MFREPYLHLVVVQILYRHPVVKYNRDVGGPAGESVMCCYRYALNE